MDSITEEEKKIVDELRNRTINDVTPKMLEDVSLFYRFAKARDFNLTAAEAMMRDHLAWRKEWKIDDILTDYEPPEVLVKYGCSSFIGFDKAGTVMRIQDFGRVDAKGYYSTLTKQEITKYSVFLAELDKAAVLKKFGKLGRHVYSPIYDFDELTYATAVDLKALQVLVFSLKTVLDNYPEQVRVITVINAPMVFSWLYAGIKPILPLSITKKIRIYGKDGFKDVLVKEIDPDDLPAYLGGNRTDPDGNPLCETFIQRGKPVPKSYYKENEGKRLVLGLDAEKIIVKPFSHEEISFEIEEKDLCLQWEFEIKKGDIDFSLKFREKNSKTLESVVLIPKQRISTSIESEKGYFKCERIGTYTIVFDNSYSWLQSKEIYYRVELKSPKNTEL